jgi:hypothetical protein
MRRCMDHDRACNAEAPRGVHRTALSKGQHAPTDARRATMVSRTPTTREGRPYDCLHGKHL